MSLFPERDLTPEERAAHDEDPRPGWTTDGAHRLDQQQTDTLIRAELYCFGDLEQYQSEIATRRQLLGEPAFIGLQIGKRQHIAVHEQRGGIDRDPMVRLLAFRAWGDRDRMWDPRLARLADDFAHGRVSLRDQGPMLDELRDAQREYREPSPELDDWRSRTASRIYAMDHVDELRYSSSGEHRIRAIVRLGDDWMERTSGIQRPH